MAQTGRLKDSRIWGAGLRMVKVSGFRAFRAMGLKGTE